MQIIKTILLYLIGFITIYFIADWLKDSPLLIALLTLLTIHAVSLIYQRMGLFNESLTVRVNEEDRLKSYVKNLENYVFKLEERIERLESKN